VQRKVLNIYKKTCLLNFFSTTLNHQTQKLLNITTMKNTIEMHGTTYTVELDSDSQEAYFFPIGEDEPTLKLDLLNLFIRADVKFAVLMNGHEGTEIDYIDKDAVDDYINSNWFYYTNQNKLNALPL
jgi:hypothetical protein